MNFSGIFQWRKCRNHFNVFVAKNSASSLAYFTPGGILWGKRSILSKRMRRKISKMNFSGNFQWRKSRNHFNFFVAKNSASSFPPIKSENDDCVDHSWSTWRSSILGFLLSIYTMRSDFVATSSRNLDSVRKIPPGVK